ncbi:MAG: hypothetical protein CMO30_08910 [Tistrella sp.]|uniref:hypothetical protein n=1 Tax=Tistrella sp. TaxID=2024861 RepID=UPI000C5BAA12|nr:hypothetical protein [Tistrella sp.]MAD35254.1 hypothetical protein [Tistrella sp.]MBA75386.1 hypothetical protein [Tistrella sp.]|tara:strand:- start:447 stop:1190 length:744 start_codon:yes stop_codon:yes gene_type:complete
MDATKRADLKRRLKNAKARLARAEADVRDLEGELEGLDHQETLATIQGWRGVPNWSLLLDSEWGGMARHMLCGFMLDRMGLCHGGSWSDTMQDVIAIGVYADSDPARAAEYVARLRASIEAVAPFVLPHEDGMLWFAIDGEGMDGFALTMRTSPDLGIVRIDQMRHGHVDGSEHLATLGEALFHLQVAHPIGWNRFEDHRHPNEAPGESGDALREALIAFMEGCRTAGTPIELSNVGTMADTDGSPE